MTTLQLSPTWRITDDGLNRTLQRLKNDKWRDCGHFSTLEAALCCAIDTIPSSNNIEHLAAAVVAIKDAKRAILSAVKSLREEGLRAG